MTELLASAPHRLKARLPIALDGDPVVDRQDGQSDAMGLRWYHVHDTAVATI